MERVWHSIEKLSDGIGRIVSWLVLGVVLVGAWNAIARYISKGLGIDLGGNALQDLQWFGFSLIFLLGAAWTLRRDEHVRVDIFYQRLPSRARAWINVVGHAFILIPFCILVIWTSVPMVTESWRIWEQSPDPNGLPRYPIKTALPLSFALLLAQGCASLARQLRVARKPSP